MAVFVGFPSFCVICAKFTAVGIAHIVCRDSDFVTSFEVVVDKFIAVGELFGGVTKEIAAFDALAGVKR